MKSSLEAFVNKAKFIVTIGILGLLSTANIALAELKLGYVNSQEILTKYKEAQDVQAKLQELYKTWEQQAINMEKEIQTKREAFEKQSLVLTDKTKAERAQEIQALMLQLQQFQTDKLGPQGEYYKEQNRMMKPIIDKVQNMINKMGEDEGFDYIFDSINSNIVFASKKQPNLTEKILAALEKESGATSSAKAPKK